MLKNFFECTLIKYPYLRGFFVFKINLSKLTGLALVLGLLFVSLPSAKAAFLDVDVTHPYFHAIEYLRQNDVVKGHTVEGKQNFKPLEKINRAEALKILLLSANLPLSMETESAFPDVIKAYWFYPYVNTAAELEIVKGFPDGNFYPGAKVTRAGFLKMLLETFEVEVPEPTDTQVWYEPYFNRAKEFRLLPKDDTPNQLLSRGEVAEIIYRTIKVAENDFTYKYLFSGFGKASYYNEGFAQKPTASGEIYDPTDLTAAHRTLPFGTRLKVYRDNGDFVVVRINDRGPYHKNRVLDLSQKAFEELAPISSGVIHVEFEVFNDPQDEKSPLPEQIRPNLESESRRHVIPETIKDQLTSDVFDTVEEAPKRSALFNQPLFLETVGASGKTFFPDIELRHVIPEKVIKGLVTPVRGRSLLEDNFSEVTVFIQPQGGSEQDHFKSNLSGKNFSVPVSFFKRGKFDMGIVFDAQRQSRVAPVEVVDYPRERKYPSSDIRFSSDLELSLVPEDEKIWFRWSSAPNRLTKFEFTQKNKIERALFTHGMSHFDFDYEFFRAFREGQNLAIDVFQAESEDGTLDKQFTNWKKVTFENLELIQGFPDAEVKGISVKDFQRYYRTLKPIKVEGKILDPDIELPEEVFIINPDGEVDTLSLSKNGDWFNFWFQPKKMGMYAVEMVSTKGEILFNRAIYFNDAKVLPVFTRTQTVVKVNSSKAVYDWINRIRFRNGQSELVPDVKLRNVAQAYAQRMADEDFIAHTDPQGEDVSDRLEGIEVTSFAENLSFGSSLNLALSGLENSASHRKNILASRWRRMGVGLAQNEDGEFYVVQIFAK